MTGSETFHAEPERVNQVTMLLTKLIKIYKSFIERLEEFHSHDLECISSNKESLKYWENVKQLAFPSTYMKVEEEEDK